MLDLWQNDSSVAQVPQGRDLPATMGETFGDAWSNGQLATSGIKQFNAKQQALNEYMDSIKKAGGDVDAAFTDPNLRQEDALGVANSVVAGLRQKNPSLSLQPKTQADLDARSVEISQGAIAAHAQMGQREQAPGAWIGNLAGGIASGLADPYNIPMMATPLEGVGILGTAARVGLGMAGTQMANETANAQFNEKVQPGYFASGQPQANVAEAGLGGLALGAGGALIGKGVEAIAGRFMGTAERDASNAAQSEANIAQTNVLPGIEGEAVHPAALGKAIDDVLNERPVDVSQQVGALEPKIGSPKPQDAFDLAQNGKLTPDSLEEMATHSVQAGRSIEDEVFGPRADEWRSLTKKSERAWNSANDAKAKGFDAQIAEIEGSLTPEQEQRLHQADQLPDDRGLKDLARDLRDVEDNRDDRVSTVARYLKDIPYNPDINTLNASGRDAAAVIKHSMQVEADAGGDPMKMLHDAFTQQHGRYGGGADANELVAGKMEDLRKLFESAGATRVQEPPAALLTHQAQEAPQPATMTADAMRESIADPATHDAARADIERAIDEGAKAGKALQIPVGIDPDGNAIMGSATRALNDVDGYKALADAIGQCALPMAQQAAE